MLTETCSSSLTSRFASLHSQLVPQGYFRSKLFVSYSTANPLVAAASPVFALLERLSISQNLPPIDAIRDNIEHELFAFHSRLSSLNYADEFASIAHYLLSATIDELLGKNYLRLQGQVCEFKAFAPSMHDEIGPEQRFFDIVSYIKQQTNQYLDLIELAYYCLITGFEGSQHFRTDGRQTLDNLIEELYQLIQQYRVHKPVRLFKELVEITPTPVNKKPIMAATIMVVGMLTSLYFGSHMMLEAQAKSLLSDNLVFSNMDY